MSVSEAPPQEIRDEITRLEARALPRDGKLARGRPSLLFRLIEAVSPPTLASEAWSDTRRRLAEAFAPRLADRPLAADILRVCRADPLRSDLIAVIEARREDPERSGLERAIDGPIAGGIPAGLALLEQALALNDDDRALPEPPTSLSRDEAMALLEVRSQTPKALRDPSATDLARLALAVLGALSDEAAALTWICDTIAWESLRAGKEIPTLALAGLAALDLASPLPRLRAAEDLLRRNDRRVVVTRLRAISEDARAELAVEAAVIDDLTAPPLDEAIAFARDGSLLIQSSGAASDPEDEEDERAEAERARREAAAAWEQWSTRLETAMIQGASWPLWAWRAVFPDSGDPVRAALAERVLWSARDQGDAVVLRWQDGGFVDLFAEPYTETPEALGLAHPLEMDAEELKLWQEWWPQEGPRQPFPQVFRLALPEDEAAAALEALIGQVFPSSPPTPRRSRGLIGLPLRGRGPWELERRFGEDSVFLSVAEGSQRLEAIDGAEDLPVRLRSELVGELLDLLGAGFFESEAFWRDWNKRLVRRPDEAWTEAVAVYRRGPKRLAALRKRLTLAAAPALAGGAAITIQGRFARIEGEEGAIVELGSGRIHGVDRREHRPWRAAYHRAPPLPHDPATDPQGDRVIGAIAYFAERAEGEE